MRKSILLVFLALTALGAFSIVSCKKQQSGGATTDTTSSAPVVIDTARPIVADTTRADTTVDNTRTQTNMGAQTTDTTRRSTMDTTHRPSTTGTTSTTATPGTTATRETTSTAATETPATGDKGIGPVTTVTLGAIDNNLVTQGQQLYNSKCVGCHKLDAKGVGPALRNVTKELTPEYIMNIMLNPKEMEQKTPRAMQIVQQTGKHMPAVRLTQDQARAILEYLRSVASAGK